jgi:hypothetical protein
MSITSQMILAFLLSEAELERPNRDSRDYYVMAAATGAYWLNQFLHRAPYAKRFRRQILHWLPNLSVH